MNIISPEAGPPEAGRTRPALVAFQKVNTGDPRKAGRCLLTLVHRITSFRSHSVPPHPPRAVTTLKFSVCQLLAGDLLAEAWMTVVPARV